MSGAQALAGVITGAVCVIAEVDEDAIHQRITDGYIQEENVYNDTKALIARIENARSAGRPLHSYTMAM